MPNKNNECFIANYEEFCGMGSTLELAFRDLKVHGPTFDDEEVVYYRATQLKVETRLVEVPE